MFHRHTIYVSTKCTFCSFTDKDGALNKLLNNVCNPSALLATNHMNELPLFGCCCPEGVNDGSKKVKALVDSPLSIYYCIRCALSGCNLFFSTVELGSPCAALLLSGTLRSTETQSQLNIYAFAFCF